jgi:putative ABC transport system permease protein
MRAWLQDLRYGARTLRRKPRFTATVVALLALGIGANSALFSIVSAALLHPVPWKDPERIVNVWETDAKRGEANNLVSAVDLLDWRDRCQSFERVAGWRFLYLNLAGVDEPERVEGLTVSPGYFPLLGVTPSLGRTFLPEEEEPGRDKVVILSHGLWRRRFGSDTGVVGRQITVEGEPRTVVGVLPPDFRTFRVLNRELEIYIPLTLDRARLNRGTRPEPGGARGDAGQVMFVYARLKPGVSVEQARAEMDALYRGLGEEYPQTNSGLGVRLVPLPEQWGERARPALLMLLAAVGFVLLIACADAANLLLARATARRKEMNVRAALGASRSRLIRQSLTESLLLAALGGAAGLLLAFWGVGLLNRLIPYTALNRAQDFRLDLSVLGFTLAITLLTGLVSGLLPALRSSKLDLTRALNESGRSATAGAREGRLRSLLVTSEIALAVVLLVGAGLMIRSVVRLHTVDRGLKADHVLTMQIFLPQPKYPTGSRVAAFYRQVLRRVETLPGVESAAVINYPPLGLVSTAVPFVVEGREPQTPDETPVARYSVVSPEYFRTVRIPLLAGRQLTEQDADESNGVVVVSDSLARRFWPHEDAVGKRIVPRFPEMNAYWIPESNNRPLTVVGVVGDVRQDGRLGAPQDDAGLTQIYLPYLQNPSPIMHLLVRTSGEPLRSAAAVRSEVYSADKEQPVFDVKTLEEVAAESFSQSSVLTSLLGAFAALALVLAGAGVYGVTAYTVAERTREIGIRMALGARERDVLRLIVGRGMLSALTGVAAGLVAALMLARLLSGALYEVSAGDPLTYAAVSAVLCGVSFAACYVPARRAMKVEPVVALRYE